MKEELKIKDVMVGDWVDVRNDAAPNTTHLERITPSHFLRDEHWYGVELVPEILEKNGFYYDEDRKAYLMGVIFRVKPERYGLFSFEICGCPYPLNTVHELQHALRLCGIEKEIVL